MSERKGGAHAAERKSLKIDPETHAALLKYAQSKKLSMGLILSEFIAKGVEHDIHDPQWIEKLIKAEGVINKYANLDEACPALAGGQKSSGDFLYRCIWFRPDSPPNIKNLGDSEELQGSACISCGGTRPYVEGMKERDERIRELEVELGSKASAVWKIPVCNKGAVLTQEGLAFRSCPERSYDKPVNIEKWCRVYERGLPCVRFAELAVGVEGKRT